MNISRRTAARTLLATAGAGLWPDPHRHTYAATASQAPEERSRTQVCVIGGGSGGIGAALAAARGGAQVVLLEREAILGGTSTNAWVHTWEPVAGANGIPRDLYQIMKADPTAVTQPIYESGAPRRGRPAPGRPAPVRPRG